MKTEVKNCSSAFGTIYQQINKHNTCSTASSRTTWTSRHQGGKAILDFNEARDDWVAVASAGPYANHLLLGPDR